MTLKELIKYLRVSILDDTGGINISWEDIDDSMPENEMLRWSNEELTQFINEAISRVHRSIYDLKDHQSSFDISVSSSDESFSYPLDSRIIKVVLARRKSDKKGIDKLEIDDIWGVDDGITGKIEYFIVDYNKGEIGFYPKSNEDETIELLAYREELTPLSWTSPDSSPELHEKFQISALNYAAYLAYQKDEANSLDPNRAQSFLAKFLSEFDNNSAYTEMRRLRTRNKTIRYGGL